MKFEPFYLLKKFIPKIADGNALDIGAGNGHNSFFMTNKQFRVIAIDTDEEKIKLLKKTAKKSNLKINVLKKDVRNFDFSKKIFNIILAVQSLNFIKRSDFIKVISKIKEAVVENGIIIISMFTKEDASFVQFKKFSEEIEKNTFFNKKSKNLRFFLEKNELKKLFKDFEILFYEEKIIKDAPHDEMVAPHKHGIVQIVAKKKRAPNQISI